MKIKKTADPTPAPATAKKSKADPAPVAASINKGVTTGMRVMQYQDHTLAQQVKRKLSDEALAADWRREFPKARGRFDAAIVAGVRRLFNAGKHGTQQVQAPAGGVLRYDEHGKVTAEVKRGSKKTDQAA